MGRRCWDSAFSDTQERLRERSVLRTLYAMGFVTRLVLSGTTGELVVHWSERTAERSFADGRTGRVLFASEEQVLAISAVVREYAAVPLEVVVERAPEAPSDVQAEIALDTTDEPPAASTDAQNTHKCREKHGRPLRRRQRADSGLGSFPYLIGEALAEVRLEIDETNGAS